LDDDGRGRSPSRGYFDELGVDGEHTLKAMAAVITDPVMMTYHLRPLIEVCMPFKPLSIFTLSAPTFWSRLTATPGSQTLRSTLPQPVYRSAQLA